MFGSLKPAVNSKPTVDSKPVVIIPLGLLIVPDDKLAFSKLSKFISKENQSKITTSFLKSAMPFIEQFKNGKLNEKEFENQMVGLVKSILKAEITVEEFNACWLARYNEKSVKDFKSITSESTDHAFVIYTATNRKDEERIKQLCHEKKIAHTVENDHLKTVQGIEVRKTFVEHLSKKDLFLEIAKKEYQAGKRQIYIVIGSGDSHAIPALREALEKSNESIIQQAELMNIHVIKANPREVLDITDLLQQEKQTIVCKL